MATLTTRHVDPRTMSNLVDSQDLVEQIVLKYLRPMGIDAAIGSTINDEWYISLRKVPQRDLAAACCLANALLRWFTRK